MSPGLVPVFYALAAFAAVWLALLCCARLHGRRAPGPKALCGLAGSLLLFVPVDGLALWSRAFSFYPNPSLPVLGILCVGLLQRLLGMTVFAPADWRATWWFGAGGGTLLYLHPMAFGGLDLYFWGWEPEVATWVLALAAIGLLAGGSRLGVLLLAALIAFALGALESRNCWDYVMDPIYWLVSLGVLGTRAISLVRRRPSTRDAQLDPAARLTVANVRSADAVDAAVVASGDTRARGGGS